MTGGTEINQSAIARCDPSVSKIVGTATQVALYNFVDGHAWEKTDVEGCLFIYERSAQPKYSFLVMNRQHPKDFIEPITADMDLNLQKPYIFYRKRGNNTTIHGLWFFEENECERTANVFKQLIEACRIQERLHLHQQQAYQILQPLNQEGGGFAGTSGPRTSAFSQVTTKTTTTSGHTLQEQPPVGGGAAGDIMTLLSKAQSDYVKAEKPRTAQRGPRLLAESLGPQSAHKVLKPTPLRLAKKEDKAGASEPSAGGKSECVPHRENQPPPSTGAAALNALFSGQGPSGASTADGAQRQQLPDMLQRLLSCPVPSEGLGETLSSFPPEKSMGNEDMSASLEVFAGSLTAGLLRPDQLDSSSASSVRNETLSAMPLPMFNSTPSKPGQERAQSTKIDDSKQLLTPADLMTSDVAASTSDARRPASALSSCLRKDAGGTGSEEISVTPLTKEQLQQALIHMIKTDADFVSKLHEHYVRSLNENLSKKRHPEGF